MDQKEEEEAELDRRLAELKQFKNGRVVVMPNNASYSPAILNVIEFFVTDGLGRWLLHKHGSACSDEVGKWDFGGGKQEFAEDRYACLIRELREEYGAKLGIRATRQLEGYTMLRILEATETESPVVLQHLEVTPSVVWVDKKTVDMSDMIARKKATGFRWLEIDIPEEDKPVAYGESPSPKIIDVPENALHSAIPYVLKRYATHFISPASMSHWGENEALRHIRQDRDLPTIKMGPHIVTVKA